MRTDANIEAINIIMDKLLSTAPESCIFPLYGFMTSHAEPNRLVGQLQNFPIFMFSRQIPFDFRLLHMSKCVIGLSHSFNSGLGLLTLHVF